MLRYLILALGATALIAQPLPLAGIAHVAYRVHDLDSVLAQLRSEGVEVDPKTEKSEFGYFGWLMDPEGNRIELWEPPKRSDPPSPGFGVASQ